MGVVCRGRVASEETRVLGARSALLMAPQGRDNGTRAREVDGRSTTYRSLLGRPLEGQFWRGASDP